MGTEKLSVKYRERAKVLSCDRIAGEIFSLRLQTEKIAGASRPGQFVSVYTNDDSALLPRPISICTAERESGILRLVFRIAGRGTKEFSRLRPMDEVDLVGPLGNGFPLERSAGKRVFLIGGGIGIPPMVELGRRLCAEDMGADAPKDVKAVLGYRDETFLLDEFSCGCVIATEDGSAGTKGNVIDAICGNHLECDVIYACGPTPMLRALKQYAAQNKIECWLSLEEKMACGIGACLSCVCKKTQIDGHSMVDNSRVCTEGPVFAAEDVIV